MLPFLKYKWFTPDCNIFKNFTSISYNNKNTSRLNLGYNPAPRDHYFRFEIFQYFMVELSIKICNISEIKLIPILVLEKDSELYFSYSPIFA